jgi:1-phosphofructokinase family hexose kinase
MQVVATVTLNPSLDEWVQLEVLRAGELNRAEHFARYPGGKGINVSRVIHELGGKTIAYGLSGGDDGRLLQNLLREIGIRHAFVAVGGATRNNYKLLTRRPRQLTEINTPGPRVSAKQLLRLKSLVCNRLPKPRLLVLSGSLPPGVLPGTYRGWISDARRRNIPAILDASGQALRKALSARPWLIKPNRQEAAECLAQHLDSMQQAIRGAAALRRMGPQAVVLSLGAQGALLCFRPAGRGVVCRGSQGQSEFRRRRGRFAGGRYERRLSARAIASGGVPAGCGLRHGGSSNTGNGAMPPPRRHEAAEAGEARAREVV